MYNKCTKGHYKRMGHDKLSAENRQFFAQIARAAFSNPFSDERDAVDAAICHAYGVGNYDNVLDPVIEALALRLEKLAGRQRADVRLYDGEDRYFFKMAALFHLFHRFADRLDALIMKQNAIGDVPCPVPFAEEVLSLLSRFGFSAPDAARYLAGMYQMRRAFYFIREGLVGRCLSMRRLRQGLWNTVFTHDTRLYDEFLWMRMEDFSTLLLGETGTGKGAAASAVGRSGFIPYDPATGRFRESFTRTFTAINLSQFPESLIESELFGHRKGAFTGAVDAYDGIFSRCSPYGSIFLDEIGDVSIPVQTKLLQVLQERTYSPVGSHEKRRFEGRVVAATNRSIEALRKEGLFRDDFYYRVSSDVIVVPPLRERLAEDPGEMDELIAHVVRRMAAADAPAIVRFVKEKIARCLPADYHWPGNVRELEQCIRRLLLTGSYEGETAREETDAEATVARNIAKHAYDADRLLADYCYLLYRRLGTYEEVARRMKLDRRTVKKYLENRRP